MCCSNWCILCLQTSFFLRLFGQKRNVFRFWPPGQQKDDIETEMWKRDDSEMDLHGLHDGEEEEEESYRRYSRDITLCVHPNFRGSSSE